MRLAGALLALSLSAAHALEPRDTAAVAPVGTWSVGVFNPLRWVAREGLEVSTHPLLNVSAPNVGVRWRLPGGEADDGFPLVTALEGGLAVPWGAFRYGPPLGVAGYLTPSCAVAEAEPHRRDTCDAPGVYVVPRLGLSTSYLRGAGVLTARLDGAVGLPLTGDRPQPLDGPAPIDIALAPVFQGWRVHLGVRHDHGVLPWLRVAAEADVYRVGRGEGPPGRDRWTYSGWLGADARTSTRTRLSLGVIYWNSDQRQVALERDAAGFSRFVPVRSHEVYPTADFLWTWGGD